jgi:quercetin dioxygenase-like cupin family protein
MNASTLAIAAALAAAAPSTGAAPKEDEMPTAETARRASGPAALGAEVETDNDQVTVIRFRMAPHQTIPMHDVTPRAVVWLTEAHLRLTFPDGSTTELNQRVGDTGWLPRQRHAGENLGDAPVEFVAVVPKAPR